MILKANLGYILKIFFLIFIYTLQANAKNPADQANREALKKGALIAKKVYERPDGKDSVALIKMTLKRESSEPRVRSFYSYTREPELKTQDVLIRFLAPADIKDTGLLTKDKPGDNSQQWIFLPTLKRSREVSSSRKGGRFVGSDYFYQDLQDREVEEDSHFYKGTGEVNGQKAHIVISKPKKESSSIYSAKIQWIHEKTLLPLKVVFYDKSNKKWKELVVHKMQNKDGYWTVMDSTMTDLKNNGSTRLTVEKIKYDVGIPEKQFTKQSLENPTALKYLN